VFSLNLDINLTLRKCAQPKEQRRSAYDVLLPMVSTTGSHLLSQS